MVLQGACSPVDKVPVGRIQMRVIRCAGRGHSHRAMQLLPGQGSLEGRRESSLRSRATITGSGTPGA